MCALWRDAGTLATMRDAMPKHEHYTMLYEDLTMEFDATVVQALADLFGVANEPQAVLDALTNFMAQLSPEIETSVESGDVDGAMMAMSENEPDAVKAEDENVDIEVGAGKSANLADLRDALGVERNTQALQALASIWTSIKSATTPRANADLSALKTAHTYARNTAPAQRSVPVLHNNNAKPVGVKQSPRYAGHANVVGNAEKPSLARLAFDIIKKRNNPDDMSLSRGLKAGNYQEGILGGFVVRQEIREELIEQLRAQLVIEQAGARVTQASNIAQIVMPKMTESPTAYWPAVNEQITESDATFQQITLNPKPIATRYFMPIRMDDTLMANIADRINNEIIKSIQLGIDKACLIGAGAVDTANTGKIVGLLNISGVTQTSLGTNGAIPSFEDLESMFSRIEESNVSLEGTDRFVMSPRDWNTFKNMTDANGQPLLVPNYSDGVRNNNIYGHEVLRTTLVPTNITTGTNTATSYIFAGEWRFMELAIAGGIELRVNDQTRSSYLQNEIIAFTHVDMAVHHTEAFEVLTGVSAS